MHAFKFCCLLAVLLICPTACGKNDTPGLPNGYRYFEVAKKNVPADWRDTSFVVATSDSSLLLKIDTQLTLPVNQRKLVNGELVAGSGGYNRNASHTFKWHFREDGWTLADVSAEIYDGLPYTDVDVHLPYWLDTVKRFAPWSFYIRKEIK